MTNRYLFSLFCWLTLSSMAAAQQPLVLSLEDAIDIALNQSYTVQSHRESRATSRHYFNYYQNRFKPRLDYTVSAPTWRERVTPIPQANGLPVYNSTGLMQVVSDLRFTYTLPTGGDFTLSSQFYREKLKTVLALQDYRKIHSDKAQSSLQLSFSQPIFTRNELQEGLEDARLKLEKIDHSYTRGQYEIIYQVTQSFYGFHRISRVVDIDQVELDNSAEAYRIARLRGEAGRIPEGDVLNAEVEFEAARADLSESHITFERTRDAFIQLIGLPLDTDIAIDVNLNYTPVSVEAEQAVQKALKNRLEIQERELDINLQEIKVDQAGRVREFSGNITAYYDITGVSTIESGSTSELFNSAFENIADRPPNRGVTLSLSYPLYDWGRGHERVQQEQATLRNSQLALADTRRTIIREVRDIVRSMDEARDRIDIRKKNQDLAQRSYDIALMRFERGDIDSQDLAQTQENMSNAQLTYLDAFIKYQTLLADLKRQTLWDFSDNTPYDVGEKFQDTKE
jgi:outer membrane protein